MSNDKISKTRENSNAYLYSHAIDSDASEEGEQPAAIAELKKRKAAGVRSN